MTELTREEKQTIFDGIASIVRSAARPTEMASSEIIFRIEYAGYKVNSDEWSEKRARNFIERSVKASAASLAAAESLKERETKIAVLDFVNSLYKMINSRVGFDLLPTA